MMPKRINFSLTDEELATLEEVIKTDVRPEVVKRAIALRMLHKGQALEAVAEAMMVTRSTIYEWHHRREVEGLAGLADRPKSGRPRKADANYCQQLGEVLELDPATLGYTFTVWTTDRLRAHLEKVTGISLSRARFALLMQD